MCDKAVSNELFMLKYCPNGCKSQERFDKAFDDFLPPLKFVPD